MSSLKRFAIGMPAASLAGGVASFLGTFLYVMFLGKESEREFREAIYVAFFVGFWAFLVCLAYTLVLGLAVYAYARVSGRTPPLWVALLAGFLGALPFVFPIAKQSANLTQEVFFIPVLALVSALVTAYTFWRLALRSEKQGKASLSQLP